MTYAITDFFDSPLGLWETVGPWDGTEAFDSEKAFIGTQSHIDVRCFLNIADTIDVPQTELEGVAQTVLDGEEQIDMEQRLGLNSLDEGWVLSDATGTDNDLAVGVDGFLDGWSDARFTLDGTALACDLDSVLVDDPMDLSTMTYLSIVFPNHITFDNTSYILLTSGADLSHNFSAEVTFADNLVSLPEVRLDLTDFENDGFDLTHVTGIRIHLVEPSPTIGSIVRVCAVRAITTDWTESYLDLNTRLKAAVVPVTLDGNAYGGDVVEAFEFVRGDGTKLDPIPSDTVISLFFAPGGQGGVNLATGSDHNHLGVILREIKDIADGTGSHIVVQLNFNDSETIFEAKRTDTTGGSPPAMSTDFGDFTTPVGGALDPLKRFQFKVQIRGTQIDAWIYETDVNNKVLDLVWHLDTTLSNAEYTYRNGRVGFVADFLTRDAYLDDILVSPTGFASLTTEVFESRTPVDGAQLTAVSSSDMNLWDGFDGPDLFFDNTKTTSGGGSFRTQISLLSNTFIVDDWTQSYLDLDIWVPANVTRANQPIIQINTDSGAENIVVPKLQPAQWNHLHFDMGLFRNLLTGVGYSFSILAAPNPDKALGNFWVDSVVFGRRRVAWSMRAQENGVFRQFGFMLNNPIGAVHLPSEERGMALQIRAEALTDDAWVSSFKVFPRYAEVGRQRYVSR